MLGKINFKPIICDPLTLDNCPLCGKKGDGTICKECAKKLFKETDKEQTDDNS